MFGSEGNRYYSQWNSCSNVGFTFIAQQQLMNNRWNFLIFREDCNNSAVQRWSIYYSGSAYAQIRLGDPYLNYCLDGINSRCLFLDS